MNGLIFMYMTDFTDSIDAYEKDVVANSVDILTRKPEPVLPKSRQPAVIEFTADLSDLSVTEICVDQGSISHEAHCNHRDDKDPPLTFSLHAGRVSAKLKPVMGKSIDPDDDKVYMCSVRSVPIAETEFRLEDVNASIAKGGNEFQMLAKGVYRAINGKLDEHENELTGDLTIGKVNVAFRAKDKDYLPLKPDYEARRFEESFLSCSENKFVVPAHDDDCSLVELGL
jgi:hypothetical protein